MGRVAVLPDSVIDQIAAGEVVERPASVVKELVENALDAGARHVSIDVDGGGRRLIRVVDDGHGMDADDARLALTRHATSKLRAFDDLATIATMGFRGEALPSIASVSRLTLTSRVRTSDAAVQVTVDNGAILAEAAAGAAPGTTVVVRELLANVPARLKFLRGEATEAAHVTETVIRLALAHPEVGFRLRQNGRPAVEVAPSTLAARVRALLGTRLVDRLHEVAHEENGVRVRAFLAAPELAQTTARGVQLFAGRRWVRDRGLLQAVAMGYGELVPRGRYPIAVVLVDVPGGDVDVNVHPQKLEVRFSDPSTVTAAVRHAVRAGVASAPWLSETAGSAPVQMHAVAATAPPNWPGPRARRADDLAGRYSGDVSRSLFPLGVGRTPQHQGNMFDRRPTWSDALDRVAKEARARGAGQIEPDGAMWVRDGGAVDRDERDVVAPRDDDALARDPVTDSGSDSGSGSGSGSGSDSVTGSGSDSVTGSDSGTDSGSGSDSGTDSEAVSSSARAGTYFANLRYLGQLDRTYLVCEGDGEMVLLDQHAAHERIAFQRLRDRADRNDVAVQRLLFPQVLDLPPAEAAVAADSAAVLARVGFDVEPFGGASIAVKAVPAGLRHDPAFVLRELLGELAERGGSRAVDVHLDHVLATVACHSVVRAGDALSADEVTSLLAQMDDVDFRAHCPHGRPVLLRIGTPEIARRFGR